MLKKHTQPAAERLPPHFNTAKISRPKNAFPLHLSFDAVAIFV
jgi:hypothetical protein